MSTHEQIGLHRVCPKACADDGSLVLGAAPCVLRARAVDELAIAYDPDIRVEEMTEAEIDLLIERLTTGSERHIELQGARDVDESLISDVRDLATQPPVIRFVNLLVRDAYESGASDIHLEASRLGLTARFRLDGVLVPAPEPPAELRHAVVSRIKLLAELDIAERRRPQDGRIRVRLEARELDLRVSTVPTMHGESVVLRLLDRGGRPVGLAEQGMEHLTLAAIESVAARPHGMLLVTGPTGSGETTTLYATLGGRRPSEEKIITVEDPIEYQFDGTTQVPVHGDAGVNFATAHRSILRQDPDVVMIGEMRDSETAEIAVQAAMSGHLVLSALRTNEARGAIPRLIDLVAELTGRPAGKIQLRCGVGCRACRGSGFWGRLGIFEFLPVIIARMCGTPLRGARAGPSFERSRLTLVSYRCVLTVGQKYNVE